MYSAVYSRRAWLAGGYRRINPILDMDAFQVSENVHKCSFGCALYE